MEIEILEEDGDNTLYLDDKYANTTIDVYPTTKTFSSRMSLKDDVYYRTEQFEYRIKTDPIRLETRLTERLDEPPPDKYAVKDGVVLESDILADRKETGGMTRMTKEFVDGLKKEVEWHESWVGDPVSIYILSKHPEIISPDDYRKYLRQLSEKIKAAIKKVEKFLETDEMGLQVTDEYESSGRAIWYPQAKQDKMSKEETDEAIKHTEKIQEQLFGEKSPEFVGISEAEFRSSPDILKHIESMLSKKEIASSNNQNQERQERKTKTKGIILSLILTLLISWVVSLFVGINFLLIFVLVEVIAFIQAFVGGWVGRFFE